MWLGHGLGSWLVSRPWRTLGGRMYTWILYTPTGHIHTRLHSASHTARTQHQADMARGAHGAHSIVSRCAMAPHACAQMSSSQSSAHPCACSRHIAHDGGGSTDCRGAAVQRPCGAWHSTRSTGHRPSYARQRNARPSSGSGHDAHRTAGRGEEAPRRGDGSPYRYICVALAFQ